VHAFDDRVDRHDEATSVAVDVEHRRVVADAKQHVRAMIVVREVTSDDVEFAETHRDALRVTSRALPCAIRALRDPGLR
jgi:hypothetical protein